MKLIQINRLAFKNETNIQREVWFFFFAKIENESFMHIWMDFPEWYECFFRKVVFFCVCFLHVCFQDYFADRFPVACDDSKKMLK